MEGIGSFMLLGLKASDVLMSCNGYHKTLSQYLFSAEIEAY